MQNVLRLMWAGLIILSLTLFGCGKSAPKAPKALRQAADVIEQMSSKRRLSKTGFMLSKDKTPSGFVSYIFSSMGAAEWPPHVSSSSLEKEQAQSIGETLIPDGVAFYPNMVNPKAGQQLVVSAEDNVWQVVVEGYIDPTKPPVFRRTWAFPRFKVNK